MLPVYASQYMPPIWAASDQESLMNWIIIESARRSGLESSALSYSRKMIWVKSIQVTLPTLLAMSSAQVSRLDLNIKFYCKGAPIARARCTKRTIESQNEVHRFLTGGLLRLWVIDSLAPSFTRLAPRTENLPFKNLLSRNLLSKTPLIKRSPLKTVAIGALGSRMKFKHLTGQKDRR